MDTLSNYQVVQKIHTGFETSLYRLRDKADSPIYLAVVYNTQSLTPAGIAKIRQENSVVNNAGIIGAPKLIDIIESRNKLTILYENFDGVPLSTFLSHTKTTTILFFLKTAVLIAEALGHIHSSEIIHKNLKPESILINVDIPAIMVKDLGLSPASNRLNDIFLSDDNNNFLSYISPEQTGRTSNLPDYRTDLYSLGIIFFQMLTGAVPFKSTNPLEAVYSHIAVKPDSPVTINPAIPVVVSDIVMKLLSKPVDDRYISSFGLMSDLQKCIDRLDNESTITNFKLGENDFPVKYTEQARLFGRETEINRLLAILDNTCPGKTKITLVTGPAGIGKSSLIQDLSPRIKKENVFFISGKFGQLSRDLPYGPVIDALKKLIRQLLSEPKETINSVKSDLLNSLGPNGKILTDFIPDAELIIGIQPDVMTLNPEEEENRFNLVLINFLLVFLKSNHSVTLFLDDLHWADIPSMNLIKTFLINPETQNFHFIGAYRENEVDELHPVNAFIRETEKEGIITEQLPLSPLAEGEIVHLVEHALKCNAEMSQPLAEIIHKKTNGNPLFIQQFLHTLFLDNIIKSSGAAGLDWDIDKINKCRLHDDLEALMISKIKRLPEISLSLLKICACFGNDFNLDMIAEIQNTPNEETFRELTTLMVEGLIEPSGSDFIFYHDKIQEAVYKLIPHKNRAEFHQKIGKAFLKNIDERQRREKLFYIVDHLNLGAETISSAAELEELVCLNLEAGRKAKSSAAFQPALSYLKTGLDLLEDNAWESQYNRTYTLYFETAEAALLCADFSLLNSLIETIEHNAVKKIDRIKPLELKMKSLSAQKRTPEAIDEGIRILNTLGFTLPAKPNKLHVLLELIKILRVLNKEDFNTFLQLKENANPEFAAAGPVFVNLGHITHNYNTTMMIFTLLKGIQFSLKYGYVPHTLIALAGFGVFLCSKMGDVDKGHAYGQLALSLSEQPFAKQVRPSVLLIVESTIRHHKDHIRGTLPFIINVHKLSLENGDTELASFAISMYSLNAFYSGKNLIDLDIELSGYSSKLRQFKQKIILNEIAILHQMVLNLMGQNENPCIINGDVYDKAVESSDVQASNVFNISKLVLCYLFGDIKTALCYCKLARLKQEEMFGIFTLPFFYFFDSLVRLSAIADAPWPERKKHLLFIASNQKKLKKKAAHAPMNLLHKVYLVEAEKFRVLGKHTKAGAFYDKAIQAAGKNGFIQEEALGSELAGKYYLSIGNQTIGRNYLMDAASLYNRWGATAKVNNLLADYHPILNGLSSPLNSHTLPINEIPDALIEHLDFQSFLDASQAISGEIVLEDLLTKLLTLLVESSGAEKAIILLKKQDAYYIEAEYTALHKKTDVLLSIPLEKSNAVPVSLIHFVAETAKPVILNDPAEDGGYITDPYIIENQPRSVLCMPVVNQETIAAIVYLENNMNKNVFTEKGLKTLNLFASQTAISIKNSILYESLEREIIRRRTSEKEQVLLEKKFLM